MLLRVRHPGVPPNDIDLGPATPHTRRSAREPRNGAVVGEMMPVLTVGGLIAISPRHGATDKYADSDRFRWRMSIRPETRIDWCLAPMRLNRLCRLLAGHKDHHRAERAA